MPAHGAIIMLIVVEGELGFLERVEVAADRAVGDAERAGEFLEGARQALQLLQERPLADDLTIAFLRCGHRDLRCLEGRVFSEEDPDPTIRVAGSGPLTRLPPWRWPAFTSGYRRQRSCARLAAAVAGSVTRWDV